MFLEYQIMVFHGFPHFPVIFIDFFFNSEAGKKSPGHFLWIFFRSSASEFIELFVGVGASRVRDIFKQAKEKAQGAWMGQHLEISVTFLFFFFMSFFNAKIQETMEVPWNSEQVQIEKQ